MNLDVEISECNNLREKLELASRFFGGLRAADIIIQKNNTLRSSILNGLNIKGFFNAKEIKVDEAALLKALPGWSNYREYTDDLIEAAKRIDRETLLNWALSRGHDLTEMLALHLEARGKRGMTAEKIELMLRLACEFSEFQSSPMGKRIVSLFGMSVASATCAGLSA